MLPGENWAESQIVLTAQAGVGISKLNHAVEPTGLPWDCGVEIRGVVGCGDHDGKAVCLLEFIRDLPRTEANLAAVLVDGAGKATPLNEVQAAINQLITAQLIRNTEEGYNSRPLKKRIGKPNPGAIYNRNLVTGMNWHRPHSSKSSMRRNSKPSAFRTARSASALRLMAPVLAMRANFR